MEVKETVVVSKSPFSYFFFAVDHSNVEVITREQLDESAGSEQGQ